MDTIKMNSLVDNIRYIQDYLVHGNGEFFVEKMLESKLTDVKKCFGNYLNSRLSDTYKNYFPFDKPASLECYFNKEGVDVEKDATGKPRFKVSILPHPVRIVVTDPEMKSERVVWEVNGQTF